MNTIVVGFVQNSTKIHLPMPRSSHPQQRSRANKNGDKGNEDRDKKPIIWVYGPNGKYRAKVNIRGTDMPKVFCLDQNLRETLDLIQSIRQNLKLKRVGDFIYDNKISKHRPPSKIVRLGAYYDFCTIMHITPAAALILAAEYERWGELGHADLWIADPEHWNEEVRDILGRLGFFGIMGIATVPWSEVQEPGMIVLRMKSGKTTDGEKVRELLDGLRLLYPLVDDGCGLNEKQGKLIQLYGAMVEAIENVVGHAYPADAKTGLQNVKRWWITGAVDRHARRTMAVVYDQGISIPASLPGWAQYGGVKERLGQPTALLANGHTGTDPTTELDGKMIHAAVEESAHPMTESTPMSGLHRGQGLGRMKAFIDHCQEGHLRIISRCGMVLFRPKQEPVVSANATSIGGTLIEWNVLI